MTTNDAETRIGVGVTATTGMTSMATTNDDQLVGVDSEGAGDKGDTDHQVSTKPSATRMAGSEPSQPVRSEIALVRPVE